MGQDDNSAGPTEPSMPPTVADSVGNNRERGLDVDMGTGVEDTQEQNVEELAEALSSTACAGKPNRITSDRDAALSTVVSVPQLLSPDFFHCTNNRTTRSRSSYTLSAARSEDEAVVLKSFTAT